MKKLIADGRTTLRDLIDNNYVDCIIQKPKNLFFVTIPATCIIFLNNNITDNKTLYI